MGGPSQGSGPGAGDRQKPYGGLLMGMFTEELKAIGEWWLPHDPDNALPGVLTFTQEHGGELLLIGSFLSLLDLARERGVVTSNDMEASGNYGRICGSAQGKAYTLEGCFQTAGNRVFGSVANRGTEHEIIHVNSLLRGMWLEPGEEPKAEALDVQILHLPYWVQRGGFGERRYLSGRTPQGEPDYTLTHSWEPTDEGHLRNGMTLSLDELITPSGDRITSRTLTRDYRVRLAGDVKHLDDFINPAVAIQQMVSIGVDRAATFESVQLHHPDVFDELRDQRYPRPVEMYAQWLSWEVRAPAEIRRNDLLFTLDDLGGAQGLARWCDAAAKHRRPLNRVMLPRHRRGRFVDDKVFDHASALEGFDRGRHTDRPDFMTRIVRCQALAGDVFTEAVGDADRWAETLRKHRDDVAHHLLKEPEDAGLLHWLAESAYYLFVLCMLRAADAPEALFVTIGENHRYQEVARRLRELLNGNI